MTREEAKRLFAQYIDYDAETPDYYDMEEACKVAIQVLEQEPCEDAISRKSLKHKLQEQHDFFVNAYGGFSNLPQNDKSRVDEISNCIAMVVNEPPVNPQSKTGHWIKYGKLYQCSECEELSCCQGKFCNECGAKMVEPQESEG